MPTPIELLNQRMDRFERRISVLQRRRSFDSNSYSPLNPFDFPFAGDMYCYGNESVSDAEIEMLNKSGAGVVREIQVIMESADAIADVKGMILNICYDGETTPSVQIPIGSLFGYEKTNTIVATTFETHFFEVTQHPQGDDGFDASLILKYQIPYRNGIRVYLTNATGTTVWWNIVGQDQLPDCWNRNLRFLATRSDENTAAAVSQSGTVSVAGTAVTGSSTSFAQSMVGKYMLIGQVDHLIVAVADATHLTIADKDTTTLSGQAWKLAVGHNAIDTGAGERGWLAAVYGGMDGGSMGMLEANTRIRLNQELGSAMAWSGTEDFFMGAFYWQQKRQGFDAGIVCFDAVAAAITAYRLFKRTPIRYTNGIKVVQPSIDTAAVQNNWTIVRYKEISA